MAWTVTGISIDADKDDVGLVTMVWDLGGPDEYTYSKRWAIIAENRPLLLAEANGLKDAELARRVKGTNLITNLQTWIDAQ